jgi:macrolide transport system ATP-binding/permease protein
MRWVRVLLRRVAGLVPSGRRELEIRAEIESHLVMHIDDNVRAGMDAREARRQAILKLGGVEMTKQAYREQSTLPFLETLMQDLRFAMRQLRRSPGFAVTAVAMLALGMAASVAIFAFVDAALIQPLPYRQPTQLVDVTETIAMMGRANLSYMDYVDWKRDNKVFSSFAAYTGTGALLPTDKGSEVVTGMRVTDVFFRTLGVVPVVGRDFYAGEDQPGAAKSVILSYPAWQRRYAGSKDVIGKTVELSGVPMTIVGVLPESFQFIRRNNAEFWEVLQQTKGCEDRRSCHNLIGVARVKDGLTVEAAQAEMETIADRLEGQYPDSNRGQKASVIPLSEAFIGDMRPILLTLLGGAGLLLLIACVNVASLLLVRSESRRREIAVRGALGASRGRLSRQFLTEALLLVSVGSVLGVLSALGAMKLLLHLLSKDMLVRMPYLNGLGANLHVMLFAGGVALMAAVVFSVTPMLRLAGVNVREGLAEGSRGTAGVLWRRLGSHLVVVELAIAVVLLVGAGLLAKSFYKLLNVKMGFVPDHLATISVAMPDLQYADGVKQTALMKRVVEEVSAQPGVKAAGTTSVLPLSGNGNTDWIRFVGRPYDGKHIEVNEREVSPGFFAALGTRLLRGRYFSDADDASRPRVVMVNEAFAKKYYPGEEPIGKVFGGTGLDPKTLRTIVGVVEDVREASLDTETWATEYEPFAQSPDSYFSLVVRTSQDETGMMPSIVAAIHRIDPALGTADEATMGARINDSETAYLHRSSAWLVGGFAVLALVLSVVGLYGVIAYSVSQRTREIGVRMALGAKRGSVYGLILREAGWLAGWGIVAGLGCAVGAAMLMRSLLFGTAAWDVGTLGSVAAVLGVSAMVASYLPARRAAMVNPVEALRAE